LGEERRVARSLSAVTADASGPSAPNDRAPLQTQRATGAARLVSDRA